MKEKTKKTIKLICLICLITLVFMCLINHASNFEQVEKEVKCYDRYGSDIKGEVCIDFLMEDNRWLGTTMLLSFLLTGLGIKLAFVLSEDSII